MQSNRQRNLDVINILKGLAFSQLQLEDERSMMISTGYFNDQKVFMQIDRKAINKIYADDIISYLSVHRIASSTRECQYLISISGSQEPFMTFQNFQNYIQNGDASSNKLSNSSIYRGSGDEFVKSEGERQMARIWEKEIGYYRTIQGLRSELIKKYGIQFKGLVNDIDTQKKGNIDFDSLIQFIHSHGVDFSLEQYQALIKKLNAKSKHLLSYKEIIRAFTPFEPLTFPTYRKQNNMNKALNYITQEIAKLQINTQTLPYNDFDQMQKQTQTGFQRTIDEFRNPHAKAKHLNTNYFYDKNYYNDLRQYKTGFFDPNKNVKGKVQNSMIGPQYHDHFFSDYYLYLEERNKSQYYYNKFGKKYAFDNNSQSEKHQN